MTIKLKLSEVKVGAPQAPSRWSNEEQQNIPLDPCEVFLERLHDKKTLDWRTGLTSQSLFLRHVDMPQDAEIYHRNFLEYLEKCWAEHLGIVVSPDIMWFTILNETVSIVKESPEPYRHLFTDSQDKKTIVVDSSNPVVMPLNRLVSALRQHVPTDYTLFLPEFSTTTQKARHAMYASFCDLCSPYYNYMTLACAFPAIHVQGSLDDWKSLATQWRKLSPLFVVAGKWIDTVQEVLDNCVARIEDAEFWKQMFLLKKCGSGHQTEVSGWFSTLFLKKPRVRYTTNYSTHAASVEYTEIPTGRKFKMQDGLFYSRQEGDFMVPEFGYTVHESLTPVQSTLVK